MQALVAETLDAWREAERVLERLPSTSPDHETVALLARQLRESYARLTTARDGSAESLANSARTIESARAVLRRVRVDGAPQQSLEQDGLGQT